MITKTNTHLIDNASLLILALYCTLIHILLNGQYGFHRDELEMDNTWRYIETNPTQWDDDDENPDTKMRDISCLDANHYLIFGVFFFMRVKYIQ